MHIEQLQDLLAANWGKAQDYSPEFLASTDKHKWTRHAAMHVTKLADKLADWVQERDHSSAPPTPAERLAYCDVVADLLIFALRLGTTEDVNAEDMVRMRVLAKFPVSAGMWDRAEAGE